MSIWYYGRGAGGCTWSCGTGAKDVRMVTGGVAGGPYTDSIRQMETKDEDEVAPAVQGGPGIHVVLPGYMCPKDMGLLDYNTTDGRCCTSVAPPLSS